MTDVTKRTPGKWVAQTMEYHDGRYMIHVVDKNDIHIATMTHRIGPPGFDRRSREEVTANAVLMALAPALYENVLWAISELEALDEATANIVAETLRSALTVFED
jgi:hypothetical protein